MPSPSGKNGSRWTSPEDAELRILWGMYHEQGVTVFARRAAQVLGRTPAAVVARLIKLDLHQHASVRAGRRERFFRPRQDKGVY